MAADTRARGGALRLRALALLLAATFSASCDAPSANGPTFAYDPSLTYLDANNVQHAFLYHWPLGTAIRVYVDLDAQPAGWDLDAAVADGASAWESEMYYRELTLRRVDTPSSADVVIHYDGATPVVSYPPDCSLPFVQAAGITTFCPNADVTGLQTLPLASGTGVGTVKMDVTIVVGRIADVGQLRRVVAHELGHVYGIGAHSGSRNDLMFPIPQIDAPSAADAQTLRYVLHQRDAVTP